MLVLSRKIGESVTIGNVQVKVMHIGQNKIIVGVKAPKSCLVMRRELREVRRE